MIIIYNKVLPIGRKFYAINLCGVLFAKGPCDKYVINHESIHTEQIKELLVVGFYLWYILEWIYKAIRYRGFYKGYEAISFEREAYANDRNLDYIRSRRRFAFRRYLTSNFKKFY